MKIDLVAMFKQLGLPTALVVLYSAVLGLFGLSLDAVLSIAEGLLGTFVLIALFVNVLKWAGVVTDGNAGNWSAVMNLIVIAIVTIIFKLYPTFDFVSIDAQIGEFANVVAIVFAYMIQIAGTKGVHLAMTKGFSIPAFSYSARFPNF